MDNLDLRTVPIKKTYFKYLWAGIFSSLITSIYTLVDIIVIGQYEGPVGTAAVTVISPLWVLFCCFGVLFGMGGSVLMSKARGEGDMAEGNRWYTASLAGMCAAAALAWLAVIFFDEPLLRFFGADGDLLPMARRYVFWLKFAVPLYPMGAFFGFYLRNDGAPNLAAGAAIAGGVLNIFGDIFCVFTLDMGISGAGLATAAAQYVSFAIVCTYLFSKKRRFRLTKIKGPGAMLGRIVSVGFSVFIIDIAMGVLGVFFNNQVMRFFGTDALAVYGIANSIVLLVQMTTYGIGNAAQPLLSVNFGAREPRRILDTLRLGVLTCAALSLLWTAGIMLFPEALARVFMDVTPAVLAIAPHILRVYFVSLPFMVFNVFITFYLQAILREKSALLVSLLRGIVLSGGLIYALPPLVGAGAIWWVMPITELIVAAVGVYLIALSRRELLSWELQN